MSFVYTKAKQQLAVAALNLTSNMVVVLVMTNTTADTDQDVATIGDFGTPDFFDGSGYPFNGADLASEAVNQDDPNNRAEFDATDLTFATLGAGTRQIQGAVLYKYDGSSMFTSLPVAFIDGGGFPITANGGDITLQWNAEGILQVT